MHNSYDNLHTGSRARLAAYRAKRPGNWREARYVTPRGLGYAVGYGVTRAKTHGGVIFADSGALDHLRDIDGDSPRRLESFSMSPDGDGCAGARVKVLPSRKKEPRYVAYADFDDANGVTIDADVYGDLIGAINAANRLAERIAEDEYEYREKDSEARDLEDSADEDHEKMRAIRQNVKGQIALIRLDDNSAREHVARLREEFADVLAVLIERRARLAELKLEGVEI